MTVPPVFFSSSDEILTQQIETKPGLVSLPVTKRQKKIIIRLKGQVVLELSFQFYSIHFPKSFLFSGFHLKTRIK